MKALVPVASLRRWEWSGCPSWLDGKHQDGCPACSGGNLSGHATDCELAAALRDAERRPSDATYFGEVHARAYRQGYADCTRDVCRYLNADTQGAERLTHQEVRGSEMRRVYRELAMRMRNLAVCFERGDHIPKSGEP